MVLIPVFCTMSWTSVHSSSGTLSIKTTEIYDAMQKYDCLLNIEIFLYMHFIFIILKYKRAYLYVYIFIVHVQKAVARIASIDYFWGVGKEVGIKRDNVFYISLCCFSLFLSYNCLFLFPFILEGALGLTLAYRGNSSFLVCVTTLFYRLGIVSKMI